MKLFVFLVLCSAQLLFQSADAHTKYSNVEKVENTELVQKLEELFLTFNRESITPSLNCVGELKYCFLEEVERIALDSNSAFKNNILKKVIDVHVSEKQFEQAFTTLEDIDLPSYRSQALRSIAMSLAKSGDLVEAKTIVLQIERNLSGAIIEIINSTEGIDKGYAIDLLSHISSPSERSRGLLAISDLYLKSGVNEEGMAYLNESKEVAFKISSQFSRSIALSRIAVRYAELNEFDVAIDILIKMGGNGRYYHDVSWGSALSKVSVLYDKAGYTEEAKKAILEFQNRALRIRRQSDKNLALANIAYAWASIGLYKNAYNMLTEISKRDARAKANALNYIAKQKVINNDMEGAILAWDEAVNILYSELEKNSNDQSLRSRIESTLRILAINISKSCLFDKAKQIALQMNIDDYRNSTLRLILQDIEDNTSYEKAFETAEIINDSPFWQGSVLYHIATSKAQAGNYLEAIEVINLIEDEQRRLSAIIRLIDIAF